MKLNEVKILIIGQNVWGRGETVKEALQNAYNPKQYQVFVCHKDTRVDNTGRVSFPLGCEPREIDRKGHVAFCNFLGDAE